MVNPIKKEEFIKILIIKIYSHWIYKKKYDDVTIIVFLELY